MGSNFSVIGVLDDLEGYIERAIEGGEPVPAGKGTTYRWYGPSGAGVFAHLDKRERIACVTPVFDVPTPINVRFGGFVRDEECVHCSAIQVDVLEDGELLFPFILQLADAVAVRDFLPDEGEMVDVSVGFFGQAPKLYADEAAFDAAQADEAMKFATQSLIPAGMFGGQPSAVLFHGIVESSELLTNEITGQNYIHAIVATLGLSAQVLLDPSDLPHTPEPGNVLGGDFWACGTVASGLRDTPRKRSLMQRLLG